MAVAVVAVVVVVGKREDEERKEKSFEKKIHFRWNVKSRSGQGVGVGVHSCSSAPLNRKEKRRRDAEGLMNISSWRPDNTHTLCSIFVLFFKEGFVTVPPGRVDFQEKEEEEEEETIKKNSAKATRNDGRLLAPLHIGAAVVAQKKNSVTRFQSNRCRVFWPRFSIDRRGKEEPRLLPIS